MCPVRPRLMPEWVNRRRLARGLCLFRWTFDTAIGAENATVAVLRAQHCLAVGALIKKLAAIYRHGFFSGKAADGAGEDTLQLYHMRSVAPVM